VPVGDTEPEKTPRVTVEVRSGRGRAVERAALAQACDPLQVWLPGAVPADLTEEDYLVFDFDGQPSSYDAFFTAVTDRAVRVHGDPAPHRDVADKPRTMYEPQRFFSQTRRAGTMVTVTTRGLSEEEFDIVVHSLVLLEP
jgi:hypothetical protein